MSKHDKRNGLAKTQVDLAKALGVSDAMVRKMIKDPRWTLPVVPPWQVSAVKRWRKVSLRENRSTVNAIGDDASSIDRDLKREKLRALKAKTAQLEGSHISDEEFQRSLEALAECFVAALEELPAAVATGLSGCTPAEIEDILRDRIDAIRNRLASTVAYEETRTNSKARTRRVGRPLNADR